MSTDLTFRQAYFVTRRKALVSASFTMYEEGDHVWHFCHRVTAIDSHLEHDATLSVGRGSNCRI